ncbi:MAG: hypothetical protein K2W80_07655 [Burkholderiales bacterium]|nr:hypothetical protein [Burkholderiales bacterium]
MFKKTTAVALCFAVAVGGCATASNNITAQSVSPLIYQSHDCDQLGAELARINTRTLELGGRLDQAASNDAALMTVGIILFWPTLFFLGGTRAQEAEYARLKGEADAVQQAAILRKCKLVLPPAPAKPEAPALQAVQGAELSQ